MLFIDHDLPKGIGMSIIAAYIFYLFLELVPSILRDWDSLPAKAIAYRRLQLLLVRLDDIFISTYKKAKNKEDTRPENEFQIEDFYNSSFLKNFMSGFDLSQESKVYEAFTMKPLTFANTIMSNWNDVNKYANALIQMPCVQNDIKLAYQLDFLLDNNTLSYIFGMSHMFNISKINFEGFLSLNQIGDVSQKNSLNNIIQLHEIAFKYYDLLKKDDRFHSIVVAPNFYTMK